MMEINRTNYEEYFLEYLDGGLAPDQVEMVELFLETNPDLKIELEHLRGAFLASEETVVFAPKEALKKHIEPWEGINADNYDEYLIREMENDLSEAEQKQLNHFIELNPTLAKERQGYQLLGLEADDLVRYSDTEELKRVVLPTANIHADNYEDYLIKEVDGQLLAKEQDEWQKFVALNPMVLKEQRLAGLATLEADLFIVYPHKEKLKKAVVIPFFANPWASRLAIAAGLALLFSIGFWSLNGGSDEGSNGLAGNVIDSATGTYQGGDMERAPELNTPVLTNDKMAPDLAKVVESPNAPVQEDKDPGRSVKNTPPTMELAVTKEKKPAITEPITPALAAEGAGEAAKDSIAKSDFLEGSQPSEQMAETPPQLPQQKLVPEPVETDAPALAEVIVPAEEVKIAGAEKKDPEFLSIKQLAIKQFKGKVLEEETPTNETELSGADIAVAGAKGVGKLFKSNLKVEKELNDDGSVVALAFSSKNFEFKRRVRH